ncbi:MAG: response regulator transcription factor [Vicinamibacterales bacterium]
MSEVAASYERQPAPASQLPRRILVVEDDPDLLRALTLRLTCAGFTVYTASDGELAIRQALDLQPDLIVLDLGLPGLSGHGVASRLRRDGRPMFPIVVLSARSEIEERAAAGQLGAAAYLVKPYEPRQLLSLINSVLR